MECVGADGGTIFLPNEIVEMIVFNAMVELSSKITCAMVCTTWRHMVLTRAHASAVPALPPAGMAMRWLVQYAAGDGHVRLIEYCLEHVSIRDDYNAYREAAVAAAAFGHVHVLEWLHAHGVNFPQGIYNVYGCAAAHRHVHVLEWLRTHGIRAESWMVVMDAVNGAIAAKGGGGIACLEWVNKHYGPYWSTEHAMKAVRCGNLELLRWFHTNSKGVSFALVLQTAIQLGQREIAEYLIDAGVCVSDHVRAYGCDSDDSDDDDSSSDSDSESDSEDY